jgi:hypothetical protein
LFVRTSSLSRYIHALLLITNIPSTFIYIIYIFRHYLIIYNLPVLFSKPDFFFKFTFFKITWIRCNWEIWQYEAYIDCSRQIQWLNKKRLRPILMKRRGLMNWAGKAKHYGAFIVIISPASGFYLFFVPHAHTLVLQSVSKSREREARYALRDQDFLRFLYKIWS